MAKRKIKAPPTTAELLDKFRKKVPGLDEATYQHIHGAIIEARTTVSIAHAEMILENLKTSNNGE